MALECTDNMSRRIKKEWCRRAFYDDQLNEIEWMRENGNMVEKKNAASTIIRKLIEMAELDGRVFDINSAYYIKTRSKGDVKKWCDTVKKGSNICGMISHRYNVGVMKMGLLMIRNFRRLVITFKTFRIDEGYEGGMETIWYESERVREEKNVQKMRNLHM